MRTALVLVGSLLAFMVTEHLIFTRYYPSIANPDSTTGHLELVLGNEAKRTVADRNQVLAVGHSRMGFFPRFANALKLGYTFATIANPGTQPRDWYYMLRAADPTRQRYRAVIVPLEEYEDYAFPENLAERYLDQRFLLQELGWTDIPEFAGSFSSTEGKWGAVRDIVFKGYIYRTDFQDFLLAPQPRIKLAKLNRDHSSEWYADYIGPETNVAGLKIDWAHHTFEAPADMPPGMRDLFENRLFSPILPADQRTRDYNRHWLGKICGYYRGTGTTVIFIRLPRGPYPRPDLPPLNPSSSVRTLALQPGVILDSEHTFEGLEDPTLFKDPMHLNGPGEARFSTLLGQRVRELLGPPPATP
jgi:hypothetical protein